MRDAIAVVSIISFVLVYAFFAELCLEEDERAAKRWLIAEAAAAVICVSSFIVAVAT